MAPRKGLQLSSSERFSLLCSVQCIFHTLSFPAGRGLETLQAVGYCLSPSLLVCLLGFLGCHFCWISLFFFFSSFPNCSLSRKPNPGADNGGLSIAKWLHSCSQGRAVARAFMASNCLVQRLQRECGDGWVAGAGSRRTLWRGLPPLPKVVIISLFIHMQAVVLDGNRLGCGRPSPKPPASLSPPPRAPYVCAICSQLAAGCQHLGRAGGSWHCHPWL